MRAAVAAVALLVVGLLAPGCETYSERISCSNGTVLNDDGDCVPPPVPDGGVSIASCAELCAMIPSWTAPQVECLQTNLMMAGPLPPECMTLATEADCTACVAAVGVDDTACALSSSCL